MGFNLKAVLRLGKKKAQSSTIVSLNKLISVEDRLIEVQTKLQQLEERQNMLVLEGIQISFLLGLCVGLLF